MSEYDIAFGKLLGHTARRVLENGVETHEAARAVAYLSLLSIEISLKSLLERAGFSASAIRQHSHNFDLLLRDLCNCEVEVELAPGLRGFVSAARLCSHDVSFQNATCTVGRILRAEKEGASHYPNQVRYGESFSHFPPEVLAAAASIVSDFAAEHWDTIRTK